MDSGFHRPKLPGFRIPDYLTWGDKTSLTDKLQAFALVSIYSLSYTTMNKRSLTILDHDFGQVGRIILINVLSNTEELLFLVLEEGGARRRKKHTVLLTRARGRKK